MRVCCAGTYFAPHTHKVEKKDAVVSGHFKMTMFGNTFVLEAGDCLLVPSSSPSSRCLCPCQPDNSQVPAGALHTAEVVGDEPVVSLDSKKH